MTEPAQPSVEEIARELSDWKERAEAAEWAIMTDNEAQFIRRAALEEAARIAESFKGNCNYSDACLVHERIAAELRRMAKEGK